MKKMIQGVLLSGLVFPGLGQIFLGKKGLGAGLIMATNIGLAGVVYTILKRIPQIMAKIQPELEGGTFDFQHLIDLTVQSASQSTNIIDTVSVTIIAGCWVASVCHACWLGRQQDKIHNITTN